VLSIYTYKNISLSVERRPRSRAPTWSIHIHPSIPADPAHMAAGRTVPHPDPPILLIGWIGYGFADWVSHSSIFYRECTPFEYKLCYIGERCPLRTRLFLISYASLIISIATEIQGVSKPFNDCSYRGRKARSSSVLTAVIQQILKTIALPSASALIKSS
jgi:hypothetical protein